MANVDLLTIIGKAETMQEVFTNLKGMEIIQQTPLGSSYIPMGARKEFVIFQDNGNGGQFIHPYGTQITYHIHNQSPESAK